MEGFKSGCNQQYSLSIFYLALLLNAGMLLGIFTPSLPAFWQTVLLAISSFFLCLIRQCTANVVGWFLAGVVLAFISCQQQISAWVHESSDNIEVNLDGILADFPRPADRGWQFDFIAENPSGKIRLSVHDESGHMEPPSLSCRYHLQAKLKRPRGLLNAGQYDYQAWLLQAGYIATGYAQPPLACEPREPDHITRIRMAIAAWVDSATVSERAKSTLLGLLIGSYADIDVRQWQILRDTGTIHLLSVSGLHIVMVAALVHFLMAGLVRLLVFPLRVMPAVYWGGCASLLAAIIYALLAGFSVATQRSLIMVAVAVMQRFLYGRFLPGTALILSMTIVMISNPMTVLSAGFWFSFIATALLGASQRGLLPVPGKAKATILFDALHLQWLLFLLMAPVLLYVYGRVPLLSLPMNLIAVPWVSFVSLPLGFAAVAVQPFYPPIGQFLLQAAGWSLDAYWQCMAWGVSYGENWQWSMGGFDLVSLVLALAGLWFLCLAPPGLPLRFCGVLLCLPLFFPRDMQLHRGDADMHFLDVGQGLSVIVHTAGHVLVFDTGNRSSSRFDIGRDVVAPALRNLRIRHIDMLMLSHADSDHAGGAPGLLQEFNALQLWSGTPEMLPDNIHSLPCRADMHWRWDNVDFRVLAPDSLTPETEKTERDNNRSCVLLVTAHDRRVMLTGDIEEKAELQLVRREADLHADVLSAPHHGSKTSSSSPFLRAVKPEWVIISAGYLNRFHHPAASIVKRYDDEGIKTINSAENGSVRLRLTADGMEWQSALCDKQYFWRTLRYALYCRRWHSVI